MTENKERDTHFQGFAKSLYPELDHLFNLLYRARLDRIDRQIEQSERMIKLLLTRRAYDLVYHTLYYEGDPDPVTDWSLENILKRIPDLTEWPTPESS